MKIGIIGAGGKSGRHLTAEALSRGYDVTAIVRNAKAITEPKVAVLERDIFAVTPGDVAGFDAVIDAFRAGQGREEEHLTSMEHLISVFERLPKVRLLVVGGAGSLFTDASVTQRLMDAKDFPPAFLPTASNMGKAFEKLKASGVLWTYLSPAATYDPDGRRTGSYVAGGDALIMNKTGESYVSYADYAVAMIDELAARRHLRGRFTVVSERG